MAMSQYLPPIERNELTYVLAVAAVLLLVWLFNRYRMNKMSKKPDDSSGSETEE